LPPLATIFVGGGGRRPEQRVGLYTSGIGGVAYLAGKAGISSKRFPAELLRFAKLGLNLPRLKEEENLRSLRLLGVVRCAVTWDSGLSCVEGALARNSCRVCASGMLCELIENSRLATLRILETADLRRITFSDDDTGDRSSTDVGGVEEFEALELFSKELLGVDATLRWWRVAVDVSSFESRDIEGL
jgi:hypothetical protein